MSWSVAIQTQEQQKTTVCCLSKREWTIWISKVKLEAIDLKMYWQVDLKFRFSLPASLFYTKFVFWFSGLNLLEGQVTRYTSNEHLVSPNENTVRMDTQRAGSYLRRTFSATTPPSNLMFAQSPPNMEGPVTFVAPGLAEETLMGVSDAGVSREHIIAQFPLMESKLTSRLIFWKQTRL